MTKCSACFASFSKGDYAALAAHYYSRSEESDASHVMWLNRLVTNQKVTEEELEKSLKSLFNLEGGLLSGWIRKKFVARFYGDKPHPFVMALQHPTERTLLGYVIEHQHFLRQWVRSCSYIMAKTEEIDATMYELDNINTEFGGIGTVRPSHYELLLRMGESLGMDRRKILATPPLPDTARAIDGWNDIAQVCHWVETMAAMHGLELIADRALSSSGARLHYFDPEILDKDNHEVTEATKDFLREGYEADIGHSKEALDLVDKYSREFSNVEDVQATFLRSIDLFYGYLLARLDRGELLQLEN